MPIISNQKTTPSSIPTLKFLKGINLVNLWIELFILFILALSLRETIGLLYADDDLVTSLYRGIYFPAGVTFPNFLNFLWGQLTMMVNAGRFMIGDFLVYLPMIYFNIVQYRIYVIALICLDVWLFGACIYQWTGSHKLKWFSMLGSMLFFQVHFNFHHPFLAYWGMMQQLFLLLFASIYTWGKYLENKKKFWLIISLLLSFWALIFYEVSYAFFPIYLILTYFRIPNIKKALIYFIPQGGVYFAVVVLNFLNRSFNTQNPYPGTTFSLDIGKILITFIKQIVAAFPLANFFANNWNQYHSLIPKLFLRNEVNILDVLLVFLFLLACFFVMYFKEELPSFKMRWVWILGFIGLLISTLPAALIGLSAKYQDMITWGKGHVPVYFQYFGLLILAVLWLDFLFTLKTKNKIQQFFARLAIVGSIAVASFVLLVNQQYGRIEIKAYNNLIYNKMIAIQYALEDGLIKELPNDTVLINTQIVPTFYDSNGYSAAFFANYSQKPLSGVVYIDNFIKNSSLKDLNKNNKSANLIEYFPEKATYIIRTNALVDKGVVYLGKIQSVTIDLETNKVVKAMIDQIKIYAMNANQPQYISLYERKNDQALVHEYYKLEPYLNEKRARGVIYTINFPKAGVDFNSLFVVGELNDINPDMYAVINQFNLVSLNEVMTLADSVYNRDILVSGWSYIEPWGTWSEGSTSVLKIKLDEIPDRDLQVEFSMNIFAPKENLTFTVLTNGNFARDFSLANGGNVVSVPISRGDLLQNNGNLKITFLLKNPISPALAGISGDPRVIGIGLQSLVVR